MEERKQSLLTSAHLYEVFNPYMNHENWVLKVVEDITAMNFYKGIELGILFQKDIRKAIRDIVEKNNLNLTQYATPYLKSNKLSLCELNKDRREAVIKSVIEMIDLAGETGCTNFGVVSGDDPGENLREDAKKALEEAMIRISEAGKNYGMNIILEPLDRYAYKKQLIGPMKETVEWFEALRYNAHNAYIHWDSAHEALGEIDLVESLNMARPYIAQVHLCNAILDKNHPCFGDLHMEVGEAPDFTTEGYLVPEVGSWILKTLFDFPIAEGIDHTYVSVEVKGHPGDDLWRKERISREFLKKSFELGGISYQ